MAITPTQQMAGQRFVIAGNDCPPPMTVTGTPGAPPEGAAFRRHPDGTWSLRFSFPLGDRSDQATTVSCINPKSGETVFTYPQRIHFIVSTPEYLMLLGLEDNIYGVESQRGTCRRTLPMERTVPCNRADDNPGTRLAGGFRFAAPGE